MVCSYHGGKARPGKRIADKIIEYTQKYIKNTGSEIYGYCEPFSGMNGVYQHIPEQFDDIFGDDTIYLAGDLNESVILMWQKLQNGWKPPLHITKQEFEKLKDLPKPSALKGYVGHQYSWGGKFFKGYAPQYGKVFDEKKLIKRLVDVANNELGDVKFIYGDYKQFSGLENFVIYCDPPYVETEKHYVSTFDYDEFYKWCRMMVHEKNNIIFLSEYKAPKDFKLILSICNKLTGVSPAQIEKKKKHISKVRTENLYMLCKK